MTVVFVRRSWPSWWFTRWGRWGSSGRCGCAGAAGGSAFLPGLAAAGYQPAPYYDAARHAWGEVRAGQGSSRTLRASTFSELVLVTSNVLPSGVRANWRGTFPLLMVPRMAGLCARALDTSIRARSDWAPAW